MTPVPAVGPEESVPVTCVRCGETEPTTIRAWRHNEAHVTADRAMLRPSRRGAADKAETRQAPLRLVVGL